MWYAIVAILILIADQGLKYWVTVNIALDTGHVTLIPGVLELTNIHNNGAAFSMLEHAPHWIFILFTLVFAAIAVFCLRRNVSNARLLRPLRHSFFRAYSKTASRCTDTLCASERIAQCELINFRESRGWVTPPSRLRSLPSPRLR